MNQALDIMDNCSDRFIGNRRDRDNLVETAGETREAPTNLSVKLQWQTQQEDESFMINFM